MKPGDRVVFFPYTKPVSFGPGGYRATVATVHKSGDVSVWVTLPDGREPVLLAEVPVGEFGTSEPGTVTPMVQGRITRARQPRLSLVKPRREAPKPEPVIEVKPRQMGKAAQAEKAIAECVAEVVQPAPVEVGLNISNGQLVAVSIVPQAIAQAAGPKVRHKCVMCMRIFRGPDEAGQIYCGDACAARGKKPDDLVFGVRRSLYYDTNSPKGRTGTPQGRHRAY